MKEFQICSRQHLVQAMSHTALKCQEHNQLKKPIQKLMSIQVTKSAYHLSELTGPGELVLAGLNGKKRASLRDYARESCVRADVNNKTTWRS